MNKKALFILIPVIIIVTVLFFMFPKKKYEYTVKEVYRVSLAQKKIGYIDSLDDFKKIVNANASKTKNKYNVDKVYLPDEVNVQKVYIYNPKTETARDMYERLRDEIKVSVKGYEVTIKGVNDVNVNGEATYKETLNFYVLDKEVFNQALKNAIGIYLNQKDYEAYKKGIRTLKTGGSEYLDVNISNNITIREAIIPQDEKIYTKVEDLTKSLLFRDQEETKTYTVKENENMADIAENNKLSVRELMIANPEIKSENKLLYPGEELNVSLVKPAFVFNEKFLKEEELDIMFQTKFQDDPNMNKGQQKVLQEGVTGREKVVKEYRMQNGYLMDVQRRKSKTIKPAIDKVVARGTKVVTGFEGFNFNFPPGVGGGTYLWPTPGGIRSSGWGRRWGSFHKGLDIANTALSPIYAVEAGIVMEANWNRFGGGNSVYINHQNGLCTLYAHCAAYNVKRGDKVKRGQVIALVGQTGRATGPHVHLGVGFCNPGAMGELGVGMPESGLFNPERLYR